eukprot:843288-Amphidinium_carterae.1
MSAVKTSSRTSGARSGAKRVGSSEGFASERTHPVSNCRFAMSTSIAVLRTTLFNWREHDLPFESTDCTTKLSTSKGIRVPCKADLLVMNFKAERTATAS